MSSKLSIMALEIADRSKCSCYCRENIWWWNLEQQEGCALGGLQSFISSIFYVTCSNFISLFVLEIYYKIIHVCSPHILSFWSSWANFLENISWPLEFFLLLFQKVLATPWWICAHESWLKQVFTPWCMNCEATSKQVEKLAKHYKGSSNLIFARTDASANEHPKLQVSVMKRLLSLFVMAKHAHRICCENWRSWDFIKDK